MVGAVGTPTIGQGRLSVLGQNLQDETDETDAKPQIRLNQHINMTSTNYFIFTLTVLYLRRFFSIFVVQAIYLRKIIHSYSK